MSYVVQHRRTGHFLAQPGARSTYTPTVEHARVFPTMGAALRERYDATAERAMPLERCISEQGRAVFAMGPL